MDAQTVAGFHGNQLELDICYACHGIWFDGHENLRMAPAGVLDLFKHLHDHRDDPQAPLARQMSCPRCRRALAEGMDTVKTGRYATWRCPQRHGRFSPFSSFFIEKGFVRLLTPAEITDLAERVRVIHCTSCGAPVDLRQHQACPYCRSALSLLDPKAVERALSQYSQQTQRSSENPRPADVADALLAIEQERERARREAQKERWQGIHADPVADLWAAGLELVWRAIWR